MFDYDWGALLFWAIHISSVSVFLSFRTTGTTIPDQKKPKQKATKSCRQTRARRVIQSCCWFVLLGSVLERPNCSSCCYVMVSSSLYTTT